MKSSKNAIVKEVGTMEKKSKIKFHIIMIIAIVLLAMATIPKTLQEDTFYMIKVGEYICRNGMQVVSERIEPFAWQEGMIYTYPHWLFDIVLYLIFNCFDMFGIYAFTVFAGIVTYLLIYYTNIKIAKNNVISAVLTIASIYLLSGYITARSQIVTYLCCILTILFIERFLATRKKRYVVGLVILSIILANCHAALFPIYFIIYLPYIAEYIISLINRQKFYENRVKRMEKRLVKLNDKADEKKNKKIQRMHKKSNKRKEKLNQIIQNSEKKDKKIIVVKNDNTKWLIITFILCMFTGLITPIKDIPYTYMIKSIQGNTMNFIAEHQAVALIQVMPTLAIFLFIQILLFSNKIKVRLQDLFMLLGMSILALISYKQFPIFFICTMCIINKLAYMVISETTKQKVMDALNKILTAKGIIYIILIIVIIFLLQYQRIALQNYIDNNEYPVLATQWLKSNVDTKQMRLFNDFNYGSYLLFKDIPVFIDGRADVYDPMFNGKEDDIFLDYMATTGLQIWYEDTFKKYDITHIMTKTNAELNIFLQRNISYKSIYNDGTFTIYEDRNMSKK